MYKKTFYIPKVVQYLIRDGYFYLPDDIIFYINEHFDHKYSNVTLHSNISAQFNTGKYTLGFYAPFTNVGRKIRGECPQGAVFSGKVFKLEPIVGFLYAYRELVPKHPLDWYPEMIINWKEKYHINKKSPWQRQPIDFPSFFLMKEYFRLVGVEYGIPEIINTSISNYFSHIFVTQPYYTRMFYELDSMCKYIIHMPQVYIDMVIELCKKKHSWMFGDKLFKFFYVHRKSDWNKKVEMLNEEYSEIKPFSDYIN